MPKAKLFMNGRSQAVRLPKEFRLAGKEVSVSREGERIVLEPVKPRAWPRRFFERIRIADPSFARPRQPRTPRIRPL